MLNVLIMNRATRDSFLEQPVLYANIVNRPDIEICGWIESGSTLETALPAIDELVGPHQKWRAIVISYEDDGVMEKFATDPENPFDFDGSPFALHQQNPIPLVRLTHLLKGLPPLEKKYVEEQIVDKTGMPKMVFTEQPPDEAVAMQWKQLSDLYENDLREPEQIVLIRRCLKPKDPSKRRLENMWSLPEEIESSRFADRNGYAPGCRFLCVDYTRQGKYQTIQEAFEFWVNSTLMATIEVDGSTLQAGRLYRLETRMDKNSLTSLFRILDARLTKVQSSYLEHSARLKEKRASQEERLPAYQVTLPELHLETGSFDESEEISLNFAMFPARKMDPIHEWQEYLTLVQQEYQASIKKISRSFDRAAEKFHDKMHVSVEKVELLNQWQKEDLAEELQKEKLAWMETGASLPATGIVRNQKLQKTDDTVRWLLENQADRRDVGFVEGSLLVIGLLVGLIGFVFPIQRNQQAWAMIFWIVLTLLVVCGVGWLSLFLWNRQARNLAASYRDEIRQAAAAMNSDTNGFAKYLEQAVNLVRGSQYLRLSDTKALMGQVQDQSTLFNNHQQVDLLTDLQNNLHTLQAANHILLEENEFQRALPEQNWEDVDEKNLLLIEEDPVQVEVNHSGFHVESPWPFVSRLIVEREELYE